MRESHDPNLRDGRPATPAYVNDLDQALAKRAQYLLPPKTKWTLLGNSVHFDLRFLRRHLPEFSKHLSHRVIDCSAIRLFCEALGRPYNKSEPAHRAKDDVEESIKLFYDCRDWVASTAFAVGASTAAGGSVIVLPSSSLVGGERKTRIVGGHPPGTVQTVHRGFVDYVVTEQGIANLRAAHAGQR